MFAIFFIIFSIELTAAALGITPAKQEINFIPGQKYEFTFTIISDNPNQELELYLDGDLAEYGRLSTTSAIGSETFNVAVALPDEIISPGPHSIIVRGREVVSEREFIGTLIDIGVPIKIFVPYPGRYAELQLNIPNGNIDEEIPIELLVINRGKENLFLQSVYVDFYTSGQKAGTLSYKPAEISVAEERYFRKRLDTAGYKSGDYLGVAYADYGEIASVNQSFRVGSLFINITNFTQRIPQESIQKFHIGIESFWNREIDGVFADVNLSNDVETVTFRTPPVNLEPWRIKQLEGFIDTSDLNGNYNALISLHYAQKTTTAEGIVTIYKYSYITIIVTSLVALAFMGGIIALILFMMRRKKRRR